MTLFARLGLAALISVSSFSQQFVSAFSCNQTEAKAPTLRAGGGAELLGEIVIRCSGGTPGTPLVNDFTVYTDTNLGVKITQPVDSFTEAFLIVDDPTTPVIGTNVYQGQLTAPNALRFAGVSLNPPGANGVRVIRIVNLRAAIPPNVGLSGLVPNQVMAFVSGNNIPINNPQLTVGFVAAGYQSQLLTSGGFPAPGITYFFDGRSDSQVRFTEGFQTAFKKRNAATSAAAPGALAGQAQYGVDYNTESGFYLPTLPSTNGANLAGLATSGTRLRSVITNVPAGVQLFASSTQLAGSSPGLAARLVATDGQGVGAFTPMPAGPDGYAQLSLTNGTATAVWEILDSDPAAHEQILLGLRAVYSSSMPGAAPVVSDFAPLSNVVEPDATAPIPRFQPQQITGGNACTANCLSAPPAVTFTHIIGSAPPAPITIPITSTGSSLSFRAVAASGHFLNIAPPDGNWLSVSPSSGTTPASLSVSVSPVGLAAGRYPGIVTITSGSFSQSVYVQFDVRQPLIFPRDEIVCDANAGVPPILRSTGIVSMLYPINVFCVAPANFLGPVVTDVRITLHAPQTTRLLGNGNQALLLLNDPGTSSQVLNQNVFVAELRSPNEVVFRNVPLAFDPNNMGTYFSVTNLRVNSSQLGVSSNLLRPTEVKATVRLSRLPVRSPHLTVGFNLVPLSSRIESESGTTVPDIALPSGGTAKAVLNFTEGFASSFMRRNYAATGTLFNQNQPGAIYNTETGFYNSQFPAAGGFDRIGLADSGTRLMARFTNIPPGVSLAVSTHERLSINGTPKSRLTSADPDGAGAYTPIASRGSATFGAVTLPIASIPIVNGAATAVWEVVDPSPLLAESFRMGVVASYAGTPANPISVEFLLAPLSTVHTADFTSPIPRFAKQSVALSDPCIGGPCLAAPSLVTLTSANGAQASTTISITSNTDPQVALVTTQPSWLRVQNGVVTTPGQVTIIADPAGLANGTHSGQVTIGSNTTVNVNFTVQAPTTPPPPPPGQPEPPQIPSLSVSTELLQFTFTPGIAPPPVGLQIDGPAGLPFQIASSANWLTVTPPNGTLPATVRLVTNPGAVPAGEYEVLLTVTAPGAASRIVRVRVSITDPPQFIAIPSALNFTHTISETTAPITLYLTSKGRHGSVSVQASSDGGWLSVSPETGNTPMNIRVTINPANRAPGTYTGTIRIESLDKISAPISLPVTLVVREAASATTPAP